MRTWFKAVIGAIAAGMWGCGGTEVDSFQSTEAFSHSWGNYHWARQSNLLTLNVGDNVSTSWDSYLKTASSDWSKSRVLDTTLVTGGAGSKRCQATSGRIEVCSDTYGYNGWLGIAQIWVSGSHITQATTKVNDSYFNLARYNTPGWRAMVVCQEVGHDFGLDHQDEDFSNANLGTCMDYTSNPEGPPSNEHPNRHDYDQLASIYKHLDSTTTAGQTTASNHAADLDTPDTWGAVLRAGDDGQPDMYFRDDGQGGGVFTFVNRAR